MEFELDFFEDVALKPPPKSWQQIIMDRLHDGKVVPIVSNGLTDDLIFGSHTRLIQGWARYIRYPMIDLNHGLARMAQYEGVSGAGDVQISDDIRVKEKFLDFLQWALLSMARRDPQISPGSRAELEEQARDLTVSELARHMNYPSIDKIEANPLLLLADLPLPIFLTTSFHDSLEVALREKAGKNPRTEIYRWHEGLRHIPSVYELERNYHPTPEEPLVYHLHGFDAYPESLVLTEDDYLDFLTNVSGAILPRVMEALTQSSIIMLGYSLSRWDFKVLFRGIIKTRPKRLASVAIQLEESELEKEYLRKYLRQVNFEVAWVDPNDPYLFIRELHQGARG